MRSEGYSSCSVCLFICLSVDDYSRTTGFFGVFRLRPEWGWEQLPHSYLQSPYLTLDDKAITEYVKSISTSPAKSCQHDLCEGPSSPAPSTPPDHTSEVKLSEFPRKVGNSGCTYWLSTITVGNLYFTEKGEIYRPTCTGRADNPQELQFTHIQLWRWTRWSSRRDEWEVAKSYGYLTKKGCYFVPSNENNWSSPIRRSFMYLWSMHLSSQTKPNAGERGLRPATGIG